MRKKNTRVLHILTTDSFPTYGLPAEAWVLLWKVARARLRRHNPRWDRLISQEFNDFHSSFISKAYGGNLHGWMRNAYRHMLGTKLQKGQRPLFGKRYFLATCEILQRAIRAIRQKSDQIANKSLKTREAFWRKELQELLDKQPYRDERRTHGSVTDKMIGIATSPGFSSLDLALEILHELDGVSPLSLKKKIFPRLKKTELSPLELWRKKLRPKA